MSRTTGRVVGWVLAGALCASAGCAAHQPPAAGPSPASPARRPSAAVRQLQADLARVFGAPVAGRGSWAVDVRSLRTGETLFALDAAKLAMPASNMKIVTLATAAERLGWDYRFVTTLETIGGIEDGVLHGDLIVRGTGDPTISSRDSRAAVVLYDWVTALQAAGISSIAGRIVGDDQAFDDEGLGAGWAWDYLQYGYAAPVGALQFNENLAELVVAPGRIPGDPAIVSLTAGSGLTVENRIVTAPADAPESIDYRRRLDRPVLEVTGAVAVGARPAIRSVAVVNPTVFFAQMLKDALVKWGIVVSGPAVDFDDVAGEFVMAPARRVLASTESAPLREIASVLMKVSQNLYAETLVKAVGASRGGLGTLSGGRSLMLETLAAWGVDRDACIMADGSGLSRHNYVTASALTTILERMYRDPRHRDAFTATLPIAGRDGTTRTRMRRTRAENNAVAKTGSIANVRSLSGYVRTRDDEPLVFSILANDFVIPPATVTWITDLAVETLANFKR